MKCPRCRQRIQHPGEAHGRIDRGAQVECAPPLNPMATAFARAGIDPMRFRKRLPDAAVAAALDIPTEQA